MHIPNMLLLVHTVRHLNPPEYRTSKIEMGFGCMSRLEAISLPLVIPACAALMLFDTVVFVLVLWRTLPSRAGNSTKILAALRHEAVLYYR